MILYDQTYKMLIHQCKCGWSPQKSKKTELLLQKIEHQSPIFVVFCSNSSLFNKFLIFFQSPLWISNQTHLSHQHLRHKDRVSWAGRELNWAHSSVGLTDISVCLSIHPYIYLSVSFIRHVSTALLCTVSCYHNNQWILCPSKQLAFNTVAPANTNHIRQKLMDPGIKCSVKEIYLCSRSV